MRGLLSVAAAAVAFGSLAFVSPAQATAFGPATLGFSTSLTGGASYTVGATTGTATLGYTPNINGHTGNLAGVTSGTSSGTITFSNTVGTTLTQSYIGLFTFNDPSTYDPATNAFAGTYSFDVTSVETTAYSYNVAQDSLELSLYVLGIVSGGTAGYTGTPTSIAFDLSGLSGASYNSGTLRNPPDTDPFPPAPPAPAAVPEPAGLAMFASGLIGLVFVRRVRFERLARLFSRSRREAVMGTPALG